MAKEPRLTLLGVQADRSISLMKAIRDQFGIGLRESRDLVQGPYPKELPYLPPNLSIAVQGTLTAAGGIFSDLDFTPEPEAVPKDLWDRLDEDLF